MRDKTGIGATLRSLREQRGLSRRDIAARLYVTVAAVAQWELGHRHPSFATVADYCGAIGYRVELIPIVPPAVTSADTANGDPPT